MSNWNLTLNSIRLPTLRDDANKVAELLSDAHQAGHAWSDMAVICRRYSEMDECAHALIRLKLPHQVRKGSGSFSPNQDSIKVLTMHASKGLEFPVVALVGAGQMPATGGGRSGGGAAVLCGGDAGYAAAGDYGEREWSVWAEAGVRVAKNM